MAELRVTNWNTLPPQVREKIVQVLIKINVITTWEEIISVRPQESDKISDCNYKYCLKIGTCDNYKDGTEEFNMCIENATYERENCLKESGNSTNL